MSRLTEEERVWLSGYCGDSPALSNEVHELVAVIDRLDAALAKLEAENAALVKERDALLAEVERLESDNAALIESNDAVNGGRD